MGEGKGESMGESMGESVDESMGIFVRACRQPQDKVSFYVGDKTHTNHFWHKSPGKPLLNFPWK